MTLHLGRRFADASDVGPEAPSLTRPATLVEQDRGVTLKPEHAAM